PRPRRHRGRRDATREDPRYTVRLPREEREKLYLERVQRGHAFQCEGTFDPLLTEADPLDLHQRVLRDELAPHIGDIRAKAPRHERGERVLTHAVISPSSIARFESSSAAPFSSRGT